MTKSRWPDRELRDAEILRLTGQGFSVRRTAAEMRISPMTVSLTLTRLKAERVADESRPRLGDRKPLAISDEEMARRYRAGESVAAIARLAGTKDSHTITQRLFDQGVTSIRRTGGRAVLPEQDIITAATTKTKSVKQIAAERDVSPATIYRMLRRNDVYLRPRQF